VPAAAWRLEGDGYVLFAESHGLANVRLPWLNALSFRTRQSSAVLMSVNVGVGSNTDPRHELVTQVCLTGGNTRVLCVCFFVLFISVIQLHEKKVNPFKHLLIVLNICFLQNVLGRSCKLDYCIKYHLS